MFDICFIAYGNIDIASSRMRAFWVANKLENAIVVTANELKNGLIMPDAKAYIWQKIAHVEAMKAQKQAGKLVFWDVCEPHWWWEPNNCREIKYTCDQVVCSNPALAEDYYCWSGNNAQVIEDRFDLDHFGPVQTHERHDAILRLIWFGYSQNRFALLGSTPALDRLVSNGFKVLLTIMDDYWNLEGYTSMNYSTYHIGWRYDNEVNAISANDLALLPPFPGMWGKVKSNNRQTMASLCGVPPVTGESWDELITLAWDPAIRKERAEKDLKRVRKEYDVALSAQQWQDVIERAK